MVYEQNGILPEWLVTGRTVLLPKNNETTQAKNYHTIACQSITYKPSVYNQQYHHARTSRT